MFTWVKQAVRLLSKQEGARLQESEHLGYEAFFTLPGIKPVSVSSREERQAAAQKPLPERKAA